MLNCHWNCVMIVLNCWYNCVMYMYVGMQVLRNTKQKMKIENPIYRIGFEF